MKRIVLALAFAAASFSAMAQSDPIVMRINGIPVTRSEFEYNYNKNNSEGVVDKKNVQEYAELFVNYKLKVQAALDAKLDTLSSYQKEFRHYRDQQIRPLLVPESAIEGEARTYYGQLVSSLQGKQLLLPAHIFMRMRQNDDEAKQAQVKARMDSIYQALKGGADFAELAGKLSDDVQSGRRGGRLQWMGPNQYPKEFEDVAYSLTPGQYSEPFQSSAGMHIVLLLEKKDLESFEELRPRIMTVLERQGIQDKLATQVLDSLVQSSEGTKTVEQILDEETERFCAQDDELKYLVQEYHDGLLLFEECTREVWEPARKDTVGIAKFFKSNKKQYNWDAPRFRGLVYYCRNAADVKGVKKLIKKLPESQWIPAIREAYNKDSVMVRMERRVFAKGENANVDRFLLKDKKAEPQVFPMYPFMGSVGKVLKKGPAVWTDASQKVVDDYLHKQEDAFVAELRKRYTVEIYEDVLSTVNNHN